MDGKYDDLGPDNTLEPSGSPDSEHQSLAHTNWHYAITSRDIDALVQLKLLRQLR